MRETTKLDWRVPAAEWEHFREYVDEEFECLEGYLGREAEAAMREYADVDGFQGVEDRVNQLIEAAGRTPEQASEKNKSLTEDTEKTRVTVRVDVEIKDEFRRVATESPDPYGVSFAKAIRAYRDGGRGARLERKLDRVLDDATKLLASMKESDNEEKLSHREKNTIAIASELEGEFKDEELVETITDVAGVTSQPSIENYRKDVIERLDYEPHPHNADLWISSHEAEEMSDGTPRKCRVPVEMLNSKDRVERIRLAVGRYAGEQSSGKARVTASTIRDDVLDQQVTKTTTLDLMRTAAQKDGIAFSESGNEKALQVNLKVIGESHGELFDEIIEYRDDTDSGLISGGNSTLGGYTTQTESAGVDFDELDQAVAVTDGGTGQPTDD